MFLRLLKLLRPHQYIKNGFVFVGVVFAGRWDYAALAAGLGGFVAFCAMASAVYILNDLVDVEADRQHCVKKQRPIASGAVSPAVAKIVGAGLACVAVGVSVSVSYVAAFCVLAYGLLNVGYSLRWKHIAVLDVFIIASGFMLRILAGTAGIGIAPSSWLLLCGLMLALFLGFAKRRAEMLLAQNGTGERFMPRPALDDYSPMMIEQFMSISAACVILSYSLYTVSADTIARHGTSALIYTVPFVVYGVFRYIFILHRRGWGHDTSLDLCTDPHLIATVLGWGVAVVVILG